MPFDAHSNLGYSTVLIPPAPPNSGTSLTVAAGQGALFPAAPFNCTVWPADVQPLASNAEIVRVTSVVGDTLTIVRTQEGYGPVNISVGYQIANTTTVKVFTDIETAVTAAEGNITTLQGDVATLQTDVAGKLAIAANLSDVADAPTSRQNLGLEIGVDVQAQDSDLQDIANTVFAQGDLIFCNATNLTNLPPGVAGQVLETGGPGANPQWVNQAGAGALLAVNNLSDVANVTTSQQNLGVEPGVDVQVQDQSLQDISDAAFVQGDIIYRDVANLVRLPAGNAGEILSTQGAGADPVWIPAGGGGDLLAANNLSDVANAATSFDNIKQAASLVYAGVVELASVAESGLGTDSVRAVTPDGLFPPEADVASGGTTNIGAATTSLVRITGTTTITAFDNVAAGILRRGRFSGILTLTHNAASLILPGGANIVTAAGDTFTAYSLGGGNWVVMSYQRASGLPIFSYFTLTFYNSALSTPADSTTYFLGQNGTASQVFLATYANCSVIVPVGGTIIAVTLNSFVETTLGTNENVAVSINKNNGTTTALGNIQWNARARSDNFTGLTTTIAAGDTLALQFACPAWVTNPTVVRLSATITIRVPA